MFRVRLFLYLCILALAAATLFALVGDFGWPFELFTHFKVHYVTGGLVLLAVLTSLRAWRPAVIVLALTLVNVTPLLPYLHATSPAMAAPHNDAPHLKVVSANLLARRIAMKNLVAYVDRKSPDIVLLTEVPWDHVGDIATLFPAYPHRIESTGQAARDVVLLSRLPFVDSKAEDGNGLRTAIVEATIELPDGTGTRAVKAVGLHPTVPRNQSRLEHRDRTLEEAAYAAVAFDGPALVLGDLNSTPWSPILRVLETDYRLVNSRRGHGLLSSWVSHIPAIGLPIDHVLTTGGLIATHSEVGPPIGSDHFPIYAELAVAP